jgi:hypothetical protein
MKLFVWPYGIGTALIKHVKKKISGDDKKLFVWEYGIGTAPMKHVAEPWMHSMPAMTPAPCDDGSPKFLLGQSLDNQAQKQSLKNLRLILCTIEGHYEEYVSVAPPKKSTF